MSGKVFGESKRATREEVERIVEILKQYGLHDQCEKLEVCGSYRRGRETCGDIDIVAIPKSLDDFKVWFSNVQLQKQIGKIAYYFSIDNVQIDIFLATKENYGIMVMNYTGPAPFNVLIASLCREMGFIYTKQQILNSERKSVSDFFDDHDVFRFLNLDYVSPHNRNTFM